MVTVTDDILVLKWEKNPQKEGVLARHPEGRLIFPWNINFKPPDDRGRIRQSYPVVGSVERVLLVEHPDGKCFFAYPAQKQTEEHHGFTFVLDNIGGPEVTVVPAFPVQVIAWEEDGDIHIVVKSRA